MKNKYDVIVIGSVIVLSSIDKFSWGYFFLTLLGSILMHASANVVNDYRNILFRNKLIILDK